MPPSTIAANSWLVRASGLILFASLALGLILPKLAGTGFLLLGLMAVVWLSATRRWHLRGLHASERLLSLAVLIYVTATLASLAWHAFDPAGTQSAGRIARLLLILPLFLYLRQIDRLAPYWWHGLAAGGLVAGVYAWWFLLSGQIGAFEQRVGGATNPIYFGGIALLLAFMLLPRLGDADLPLSAQSGRSGCLGRHLGQSAIGLARRLDRRAAAAASVSARFCPALEPSLALWPTVAACRGRGRAQSAAQRQYGPAHAGRRSGNQRSLAR